MKVAYRHIITQGEFQGYHLYTVTNDINLWVFILDDDLQIKDSYQRQMMTFRGKPSHIRRSRKRNHSFQQAEYALKRFIQERRTI